VIGHYLLTLTPEQEDRLLTREFEPVSGTARNKLGLPHGFFAQYQGCRCLMMTTENVSTWGEVARDEWEIMGERPATRWRNAPGWRYEDLCERFGVQRVNAAIRTRILANQARRTLTPMRETATV
jgi:hypothetical protein